MARREPRQGAGFRAIETHLSPQHVLEQWLASREQTRGLRKQEKRRGGAGKQQEGSPYPTWNASTPACSLERPLSGGTLPARGAILDATPCDTNSEPKRACSHPRNAANLDRQENDDGKPLLFQQRDPRRERQERGSVQRPDMQNRSLERLPRRQNAGGLQVRPRPLDRLWQIRFRDFQSRHFSTHGHLQDRKTDSPSLPLRAPKLPRLRDSRLTHPARQQAKQQQLEVHTLRTPPKPKHHEPKLNPLHAHEMPYQVNHHSQSLQTGPVREETMKPHLEVHTLQTLSEPKPDDHNFPLHSYPNPHGASTLAFHETPHGVREEPQVVTLKCTMASPKPHTMPCNGLACFLVVMPHATHPTTRHKHYSNQSPITPT